MTVDSLLCVDASFGGFLSVKLEVKGKVVQLQVWYVL